MCASCFVGFRVLGHLCFVVCFVVLRCGSGEDSNRESSHLHAFSISLNLDIACCTGEIRRW